MIGTMCTVLGWRQRHKLCSLGLEYGQGKNGLGKKNGKARQEHDERRWTAEAAVAFCRLRQPLMVSSISACSFPFS